MFSEFWMIFGVKKMCKEQVHLVFLHVGITARNAWVDSSFAGSQATCLCLVVSTSDYLQLNEVCLCFHVPYDI